ncbi:MAG: tellurite resistance TerB family protein [Alphaproteobacteria bacterium]|nr:tellurite resistance TerB family protein [Alphaproteobacteria bacterium]
MVDFNDLLREIQRDGLSGRSLDRIKHAVNNGGLGSFGDQIKDILSGGQSRQSAADGRGPAAGPVGQGSGAGGGQDGGLFGGGGQDMLDKAKDLLAKRDKRMVGGIGAALGVLLGGGVKGGIGGALMAILGTAAYDALNKGKSIQDMMANKREEDLPVGMRPPETVDEAEMLERRAMLALRAMVSAAKADGQIDQRERERILDKMKDAGADEETRRFVAEEAAAPLDIDALVRDVPDQQTAAQVYAASLLAINVDTPAERAYLRDLSTKLRLSSQVVANLHGVLGVPNIA